MQTLEAGVPFGPYTIEGFIAGGGMGEVYAARHAVYGSAVALKVLHDALHIEDQWRRRFAEEGVIGQKLKHPHVLAARELVEQGGRVALVLDLVRGGQTLQRVMSREFGTGLPLVSGLQIFLSVLQGVDYLHDKGIVHGDIKPENVLLQGEDFRKPATWTPMVTDFGTVGLIAHPVIIDGQTAVIASPRYASPEHLLGVDRLEVRSDVYSLGLLLHYLLTGRHASDARSVEEAAERLGDPPSLLAMIDLPESVQALVRKACDVDPAGRFQTVREMALAVRRVLDELGVKLELEDLQAELATEVMEERDGLMRESAVTDKALGALRNPHASDQTEAIAKSEPAVVEDSMGSGRKPTPSGGGATPAPPPKKGSSADEEEAPAPNPLWLGNEVEEDPSEAPTARLAPDEARSGDVFDDTSPTPSPAQRLRGDISEEITAPPASDRAAVLLDPAGPTLPPMPRPGQAESPLSARSGSSKAATPALRTPTGSGKSPTVVVVAGALGLVAALLVIVLVVVYLIGG
jgi:serine/threonine protein kinase